RFPAISGRWNGRIQVWHGNGARQRVGLLPRPCKLVSSWPSSAAPFADNRDRATTCWRKGASRSTSRSCRESPRPPVEPESEKLLAVIPMSTATQPSHPILLYDGVCGLCNRLVQFSLKRDARRCLHFASLQSDFAARILKRHALDPRDLDTVYFVEDYGRPEERLSARCDAVISVLQQIG